MPDVYQKYMGALDWYVNNIKDEKIADLRYAAAVMMLRYRNWPEARGRLGQITDAYCTTKPEMGFKAYDALLKTYFIDYNVQDDEQKDCALGRLLTIADQFTESACSKNRSPALSGPHQSDQDLGQVDGHQPAPEARHRERGAGTEKQLTLCKEGGGGIRS